MWLTIFEKSLLLAISMLERTAPWVIHGFPQGTVVTFNMWVNKNVNNVKHIQKKVVLNTVGSHCLSFLCYRYWILWTFKGIANLSSHKSVTLLGRSVLLRQQMNHKSVPFCFMSGKWLLRIRLACSFVCLLFNLFIFCSDTTQFQLDAKLYLSVHCSSFITFGDSCLKSLQFSFHDICIKESVGYMSWNKTISQRKN